MSLIRKLIQKQCGIRWSQRHISFCISKFR